MKVSVLVPIYKCETYIGQCLNSLFSQTYDDIEYVFVDDCSPDNSIDILHTTLKRYPQRADSVKIIHNERNSGIAYTRNVLLANASGEYVYFVDSDDYIAVDAVEQLVSVVMSTNADIVRQNYFEILADNISKRVSTPFSSKHELIANTIVGSEVNVESMWLMFIRLSLFKNNSLTFEQGINLCEDWLMSIKLFFYAGKVVDIDKAFYYYRKTNVESITYNVENFIPDRMKAIDKAIAFLENVNSYDEYRSAMFGRILKCKQGYLLNAKWLDLNLYMAFHPEANKCWRRLNYGFREKVLFWLAEHKLTFIVRIILHGVKTKSERTA